MLSITYPQILYIRPGQEKGTGLPVVCRVTLSLGGCHSPGSKTFSAVTPAGNNNSVGKMIASVDFSFFKMQ